MAGSAGWVLSGPGVSSKHRSQCRPGTGAASQKCHPGAGAKVESMNRDRTPVRRIDPGRGDWDLGESTKKLRPLTWGNAVGAEGLEPRPAGCKVARRLRNGSRHVPATGVLAGQGPRWLRPWTDAGTGGDMPGRNCWVGCWVSSETHKGFRGASKGVKTTGPTDQSLNPRPVAVDTGGSCLRRPELRSRCGCQYQKDRPDLDRGCMRPERSNCRSPLIRWSSRPILQR